VIVAYSSNFRRALHPHARAAGTPTGGSLLSDKSFVPKKRAD
jgi:hypothetical protein